VREKRGFLTFIVEGERLPLREREKTKQKTLEEAKKRWESRVWTRGVGEKSCTANDRRKARGKETPPIK